MRVMPGELSPDDVDLLHETDMSPDPGRDPRGSLLRSRWVSAEDERRDELSEAMKI